MFWGHPETMRLLFNSENNLKPYDYFVYLLEMIPKYMDEEDRSFLERSCCHGLKNYRKEFENNDNQELPNLSLIHI